MKKQILNLGKTLKKADLKRVNGGFGNEVPIGVCLEPGTYPPKVMVRIPCDQLCPNGLAPFCIAY